MNFRHRSFYEVLRSDFPCNLYFDIEYDKQFNSNCVGEEAIKLIRNCMINFLEMILTIKMFDAFTKPCNVDSGRIRQLDASRSVKFSRHLVVITSPGQYVFPNNDIVSKFVNLMCN